MATRNPPPILPSKEEEHLLAWLRDVARRDHIHPSLLTAQLLMALRSMDAARRTSPLRTRVQHLGFMGSPQRQVLLRILFGMVIVIGTIVLCCLFAWVAGANIVATAPFIETPTPSLIPTPKGP